MPECCFSKYFFLNLYRISSDGIIKVADFGLAEDIYAARYFRLDKNEANEPQLLPIKWTALEGIRDGLFTEKSDVVSNVTCYTQSVFNCLMLMYSGHLEFSVGRYSVLAEHHMEE